MTLKQIYDLAIKIGQENDFRTKKEIDGFLKRRKEEFQKMSKEEKNFFDKERLVNPYSDTRIHYNNGKKIKKALAGIDVSTGGLMLAKQLGYDAVINHHPIGQALIGLDDAMELQVDVMEKYGVPVNIAEKLIHLRISEVTRGLSPINHYMLIDAAKLLDINLINIHTPADNCVAKFLDDKIKKIKPKYIGDIIKMLDSIEEYKEAKKQGVGPILFVGQGKNRCGRVVVTEITGGTDGSKEIYGAMANAGIGTVLSMHQSEEHRKEAEKANINVVIAGHISSDSVGMNLILDKIEKGGVKITSFGGLIRVKRK